MSEIETTPCRGCGAPIIFIKTYQGKTMPCDPKKVAVILEKGTMIRDYYLETGAEMVKGYPPHWGSCPNADMFKKDPKFRHKLRKRRT